MIILLFILGLLYSVLGNCFSSALTSTSSPLTLLSGQFFFSLQRDLIRIFHISNCHHAHLILNVISQTIHVSGDLFIITLMMTCSDVESIKFLSVFLHCHPLLSQILHPSKQIDLVISGYKLGFHLGNHPIPSFDSFLAFAMPISL
jgi:hypothetical protein